MDQKDNQGNGLEDDDDLIDVAMEGDFGDDIDDDISGDDDMDFIEEAEEANGRGASRLKKLLLPALILVVAVGAGGYVVLNPQILGGGKKNSGGVETAYVTAEANHQGVMPGGGVAGAMEPVQADRQQASGESSFFEGIPQPLASMNETPRLPEMPIPDSSAAQEIPMEEAAIEEENREGGGNISAAEPSVDPFALSSEENAVEQDITEDSVTEVLSPAEEHDALPSADHTEENSAQMETVMDPARAEPPEMPAAAQTFAMSDDKISEDPVEEEKPFSAVAGVDAPQENSEMPPAVSTAQETPPPVAAVPSPSGTIAPAADMFYDGRVATGPLAGVGPRKVDPELEPASQFVVVKKAHEATDLEALLVSANRALKLGRYESALDMFNQLYEKNHRDKRILMGRAVAQQYTGLSESAIRTYEEILDIDPNNADAMLNMLGLLKQQYPSVALRRLVDLQQKHPNNAGIVAQIGLTYADMGQNDEAVRYLQRAASQEPQNAQHVFNLAILSDRLGNTRNAISYYEKALELDAVYSGGRSLPRETIYSRLADLRRR